MCFFKKKDVFLDFASNTPIDKRVLKAMKPFMDKDYVGNAHSIHSFGIRSMKAVEDARNKIAQITGLKSSEIYFTSGATESNNWVLRSLALHELFCEKYPKKHIIVSATEHPSVLNTCKELEKMGFKLSYAKPNSKGKITSKEIRPLLRVDTLIVCVMAVNNETGVANSINAIGKLVHNHKSMLLVDCTQLFTYGKPMCSLKALMPYADYMTFSGHKIYGPTGVGCLIARTRVPLYSLISGGSQERGLRGGTLNTAGIVGLGEAFRLISEKDYTAFYNGLFDYLISQINKYSLNIKLNAYPDHKNIISLDCSDFIDDEELASTLAIQGIACSAGSACSAQDSVDGPTYSHVLVALGKNKKQIQNSIRISLGRSSTKKDIDKLIQTLIKVKKMLKGDL